MAGLTYTSYNEAIDQGIRTLWEEDRVIGIDLETSGLSPWNDKIAVVSLYGEDSGTSVILHVRGHLQERLRDFLSTPKEGRLWVGHNITTFDALFLHNAGVDIFACKWFDTLIAEQVVITSARADVKKSLEVSLKRRLNQTVDKSINHGGWMAPALSPNQITYCLGDIQYLPRLYRQQLKDATQKGVLPAVEFEQDLIPAILAIQLNGLPVALAELKSWRDGARDRSRVAELLLLERLGAVNLRSIPQLQNALTNLGVEWDSTRKEALQNILREGTDGPEKTLAELLLEFRFGEKIASTYSDAWVKRFVHPRAGIPHLHSRLSQTGTDTGRFSSSEPNMQQLPKVRLPNGETGRPYIGHMEGHQIISGDYSGIEAVVGAALAEDRAYLSMLSTGDMHRNVASQVFNIKEADVTSLQRQLAKAMSFTLLFGGGSGRLLAQARSNGALITDEDAIRLKDQFFKRFPGLLRMRKQAYAMASDSYPVTIEFPTGMRRVVSGQKLIGTTLLNTKVQGTAAAGMKFAIKLAWQRGLLKPGFGIGATVHDELVACIPTGYTEEYKQSLASVMLDGMKQVPELQDAPIKVNVSAGTFWGK